jgi:hypothetical protein
MVQLFSTALYLYKVSIKWRKLVQGLLLTKVKLLVKLKAL